MALTDQVLIDSLFTAVVILLAILLENRFGLRKRTSTLWHKIVNSETHFKIKAVYNTDLMFENIQDEVKSVFREQYGNITILDNGSGNITLEVDENFLVTLGQTSDGEMTIETSKLTSTMRDMRPEIMEILDVLADFEERNEKQTRNTDHTFTDEQFTADLYLPYHNTFINTYLPRGVSLNSYQLSLDYPEYDCTIKDTGEAIILSTKHREDLKTILNRLLRTWSVWWKRMQ